MGSIVAIASQKGGVGKTTTALNLGFSLSRIGLRVLLVDADPQGGLANATNLKARTKAGLVDLLRGTVRPEDVVVSTRDNSMWVLGVGAADAGDASYVEAAAVDGSLGRALAALASGYDYVIIDSPAGIGNLVVALLAASDSVITTVSCRPLAVRSLPAFLKVLKQVTAGGAAVKFEGVVVTMLDQTSEVDTGLFEELKQRLPADAIFNTVIPFHSIYETASARAVPIAMVPEAAEQARHYMDLAMELRSREVQRGEHTTQGPSVVGLF